MYKRFNIIQQSFDQQNTDVIVEKNTSSELIEPLLYHVVLLNDDFTPFDFVIKILIELFAKDYQTAVDITMAIHHSQRGIAGTYPKEIAMEKKGQVIFSAKAHEYPLNCAIERVQE